jgi:hypothetical protein
MKPVNKQIFSLTYWNGFFTRVVMYTAVFAFEVTTFGVLVLPIIMAILYSGWFLFLYIAYMAVILAAILWG